MILLIYGSILYIDSRSLCSIAVEMLIYTLYLGPKQVMVVFIILRWFALA